MDAYNDGSTNTIFGGSEIQAYVADPLRQYVDGVAAAIDEAIQTALDKIVDESGGITYEPKPLNEISTSRPNTGPIDMNGKRLENLATVPGLTIEEITATPNVAANVSTVGNYITASLLLNTAYCGPLSEVMDVKAKRVTNVGDPLVIVPDDPDTLVKVTQAVNVAYINTHALTTAPEDRDHLYANGRRIYEVDVDTLDNVEQANYDSGAPTPEVTKKVSQVINIEYALEHTVHAAPRDVLDTSLPAASVCFDSQGVNIQHGRAAVLADDYVIKSQVNTTEKDTLEFRAFEEVPLGGPYPWMKFEAKDTIYTVSDPT